MLLMLGSTAAGAQQPPLSAIGWLDRPGELVASPRAAPVVPPGEPPVADRTEVPVVTVTPLDAALPDAVGLLPSATTGLPRSMWQQSRAAALVQRLDALPDAPLPALQALYHTLLLAEADAPFDAGNDARFLLARLGALRRYGAVGPALALIERAGPARPDLFDAWLSLSLLEGTEETPCATLAASPALSRDIAARVYCAARSGDWQTAALTYSAAAALDTFSPTEAELLALYLDPEQIDMLPPPAQPAPRQVTPLLFRLYEAAGAPLPTRRLPRAFAVADLRGTAGWKAEIEAAERLVRRQALPANRLHGLYTERDAAASGGVWDRVRAVQRFESALHADDPAALADALPRAWQAMRAEGLEIAFAQLFGAALAARDLPEGLDTLALHIGLLSPTYESLANTRVAAVGSAGPDAFLLAIARGNAPVTAGATPRQQAIASGFAAAGPATRHQPLIADGRLGEAILAAAGDLETSRRAGQARIADALRTLRALGLEDTARRAALQLLILRPGA